MCQHGHFHMPYSNMEAIYKPLMALSGGHCIMLVGRLRFVGPLSKPYQKVILSNCALKTSMASCRLNMLDMICRMNRWTSWKILSSAILKSWPSFDGPMGPCQIRKRAYKNRTLSSSSVGSNLIHCCCRLAPSWFVFRFAPTASYRFSFASCCLLLLLRSELGCIALLCHGAAVAPLWLLCIMVLLLNQSSIFLFCFFPV
jgi:hypothetical protein